MDIEIVRWANVVLGCVAFLWLVQRIIARRNVIPPEIISFLCVIGFYVLGGIEVSIEAIIDTQEAGPRSYIFLAGDIALLIALGLTQKHRTLKVEAQGVRRVR